MKRIALFLIFLAFSALLTGLPPAHAADELLVADPASGNVLRYDAATGGFVNVLVPAGLGGLNGPNRLLLGPNGTLFVASYYTNSVLTYSAADGTFQGTFIPSGSGGLAQPCNMMFGPDGNFYVVSYGTGQVKRYDGKSGAYLDDFVTVPGAANNVTAAAFGPDSNLYVTDWTTHSVRRYDGATGAILGSMAPYINAPANLCFDRSGNLFVSDWGNGYIVRISSDGTFFSRYAQSLAYGIAVGPDGHVYLGTVRGENSIQRFDPVTLELQGVFTSGSPLQWTTDLVFASSSGEPVQASVLVSLEGSNNIGQFVARTRTFAEDFAPGGTIAQPNGMTVGPDGNVYVCSFADNSVVCLEGSTGAFLRKFVAPGSGGLKSPIGCVFGPDGELYVSSRDTHSVLRYNGQTGAFLDEFVPPSRGSLDMPQNLVFGPDGNLYVASWGNSAVMRYDGATGASLPAPGLSGAYFVDSGSGGLSFPVDVVFGSDGALYVSGFYSNAVHRYDPATGASLSSFNIGDAGVLQGPRGMLFDGHGKLIVASYFNRSVLVYDERTGALIGSTAVPGGIGGPAFLLKRPLSPTDTTPPTVTATAAPEPPASGWNKEDVRVNFTATDNQGGSGVKSISWVATGGQNETKTVDGSTATLLVTADGTTTVFYHATDNAGNSSEPKQLTIKIDRTPPVTTGSIVGTVGGDAWYLSAKLVLKRTDSASGVAASYYRIDGGEVQNYPDVSIFGEGVDLTAQGSHRIEYWSVDRADNEETHQFLDFKLDSVAPVSEVGITGTPGENGWYVTQTTVGLEASDSGSGVKNRWWRFRRSPDGANYTNWSPWLDDGPGTATVIPCNDGYWEIEAYAVDVAGNQEGLREIKVRVDTVDPSLSLGPASPAPNGAGWNNSVVTIPWTASDATSGIASPGTSGKLTFDQEGADQTKSITVKDKAGRSTTKTSAKINLDVTKPVSSSNTSGSTVTLSATDNLSGVKATYYRIGGGATQTYTQPFTVYGAGSLSVAFWSVDAADNVETAQSISVSATPPPAAPTNLIVTQSTTQGGTANLTWSDNSGVETAYYVERKVGAGSFTVVKQLPADIESWSDTTLQPNTTYNYRVRAYNPAGYSAYSNEAGLITSSAIPQAPSNLTAVSQAPGAITLNWKDTSKNETGFEVFRTVNVWGGLVDLKVATVQMNTQTWTETGLDGNTSYTYTVRAFNSAGTSAASNPASATTLPYPPPPAAPSGLTATLPARTTLTVDLKWADNSNNEEGFEIERSVDGAPFASAGTVAAGATSKTFTDLAAGRSYTYRVRAYNSGGKSDYSNGVTVPIPLPPAAPTNMQAVYNAQFRNVNITWKDNATNEAGYKFEYSPDGQRWTTVWLSANTTSYTRGNPPNLEFYRVSAYNAGGFSAHATAYYQKR
jgi:hypothetical protein